MPMEPKDVKDHEAVKKEQGEQHQKEEPQKPLTKEELLYMLDAYGHSIERLPVHARLNFVTHADFNDLIVLISSIFKTWSA